VYSQYCVQEFTMLLPASLHCAVAVLDRVEDLLWRVLYAAPQLRDLEARLLQEREEKAVLAGEKSALMARLAKLKDAGTDELREKAELQEALVR
jgi:hypothetical protein